ncbi:hypothetical protein [Isoptericola sp. BMS4]|uniref:hypothetical protein n=1 Tax=Isoptericola sp. BMS4 TaxID=2527875 RepID=UPI00141DAC68|nr:hypothetical protein [Isoptericola sp. BMS4]
MIGLLLLQVVLGSLYVAAWLANVDGRAGGAATVPAWVSVTTAAAVVAAVANELVELAVRRRDGTRVVLASTVLIQAAWTVEALSV